MKLIKVLFIPLFALLLVTTSSAAPHNTPKFWKCYNKVGGAWTFGRVPYACDLDVLLNPDYAEQIYMEIFYRDASAGTMETNRYMSSLYPVIRDFAIYFIERQKPNVSEEELEAWVQAVFTLANQETYWSHYRLGNDERMKIMRGDYGHGHGMLQVDDRWHFPAVEDGRAWDLVFHLNYALDKFFEGWERAPSVSCMNSPNEWRNRARSSFSSYNGGSSRICRWTRPWDKWARNDKGYASKYDARAWENYVSDFDAPAPIDVTCILNGNENCQDPDINNPPINEEPSVEDPPVEEPPIEDPIEDPITEPMMPKSNVIYKYSDVGICIYVDSQFNCIEFEAQKDLVCLQGITDVDLEEEIQPMPIEFGVIDYKVFDRHEICSVEDLGLVGVGESISVKKNINLRSTAAGRRVGVVQRNSVLQVLDFVIRDFERAKRYYHVKYQNKSGYIYAGDINTHQEWAQVVNQQPQTKYIPQIGDEVYIKNSVGINLRDDVGGEIITRVPQGEGVIVEDIVVRNNNNNIYLKINYNGSEGFIYGGRILPTKTVSRWVTLIK